MFPNRTGLLWASLLAAACGPTQNMSDRPAQDVAVVGTSDFWKQRRLAEVDAAEERWRALKIQDDSLVFELIGVWSSNRYEVTFRGNRMVRGWANVGVLEIKPPPAPGRRLYAMDVTEGDALTVPGLLEKARSSIHHSRNPDDFKVTFHPTYGYPQKTSFDDPASFDEEHWSEVMTFSVLPATPSALP